MAIKIEKIKKIAVKHLDRLNQLKSKQHKLIQDFYNLADKQKLSEIKKYDIK